MKRSPIASAFLLLLTTTGCFTFPDIQREASALTMPTVLSSLFYSDNNRWPTSRVGLVEWATNRPDLVEFTNSLSSTLAFNVQTNGSLTIHGVLAPPFKGDWVQHLDKPTNTTPSP